MGVDEIRAYLSYLAVEKNVAASTQNVALSALLFLYQQVLKMELPYLGNIERAQKPVVPLSIRDEAIEILNSAKF